MAIASGTTCCTSRTSRSRRAATRSACSTCTLTAASTAAAKPAMAGASSVPLRMSQILARRRDMRRLWITRINAAAHINNMSYSKLISGLKRANVELDRKVLADIAVFDQEGFAALATVAKEALAAAA